MGTGRGLMEDDRSVYKLVNGALQVRDIETGEVTGESGQWVRPVSIITYNIPMADQVCELVRQGRTYAQIVERMGLGSVQTIYRWRNKHPDFEENLKAARRDRADYYHDQVMKVADGDIVKEEVAAMKLKTDIWKWGAEKANPQEYGNQTKITGDSNAPLQIMVDTGIKREEDGDEYIDGELAADAVGAIQDNLEQEESVGKQPQEEIDARTSSGDKDVEEGRPGTDL